MTTLQTTDDRGYTSQRTWSGPTLSPPRIQPLADYLTVERDPLPAKAAGNLILPSLHSRKRNERILKATVTAVGPGRMCTDGRRRAMQVGVGDRVLISHYAGQDVPTARDKDVPLLREDDCLAMIAPRRTGLDGLVTLRGSNLCPVNQRVLVRFDCHAEEYRGGILAQTESDDRIQIGTVLACGPGFPIRANILPEPQAWRREHVQPPAEPAEEHGYAPLDVQPGDTVCWEYWAGYELVLRHQDDELGLAAGTYRLIRAEDLLGILE